MSRSYGANDTRVEESPYPIFWTDGFQNLLEICYVRLDQVSTKQSGRDGRDTSECLAAEKKPSIQDNLIRLRELSIRRVVMNKDPANFSY